jgi:hypothetical protein
MERSKGALRPLAARTLALDDGPARKNKLNRVLNLTFADF